MSRDTFASILSLQIRADKAVVREGEEVKLVYSLVNRSNNDVRILLWQTVYATDFLKIFLHDNPLEMISFPKILYELKMKPDASDYILLKPGQEYQKSFSGKLVDGSLSNPLTQRKEKGIFLEFEDSVIVLGRKGVHIIKGVLHSSAEWANYGRQNFGFDNVWVGSLESPSIKIVVN
ncbi:hypothetical protein HY605_04070 [Candidatus Peregrinibacteria bacterium]|nr:hypothetical protein [Candidatus Peregrinibacteria bacterium]